MFLVFVKYLPVFKYFMKKTFAALALCALADTTFAVETNKIHIAPLKKTASCTDQYAHNIAAQMVRYTDDEEDGLAQHGHQIPKMVQSHTNLLVKCLGSGKTITGNLAFMTKLQTEMTQVPSGLPFEKKALFLKGQFFKNIRSIAEEDGRRIVALLSKGKKSEVPIQSPAVAKPTSAQIPERAPSPLPATPNTSKPVQKIETQPPATKMELIRMLLFNEVPRRFAGSNED